MFKKQGADIKLRKRGSLKTQSYVVDKRSVKFLPLL